MTKQLVINEGQARRVHDFFALASGGSRPSDLAGLANLQRWPDQQDATGKWTARRILKLLNNRVYIGEFLNGDSTLTGAHQAIVSITMFNEIQNLLASRRTSDTKPRKKTDPSSRVYAYLAGKLICDQCNRPMSTSISHRGPIRYIYYRCRSDSGGTPRCTGVNVGAYRLEQFVASVLADVEDPGSELPIEMRERWVKLAERQRQKRLPETIEWIVYIHSTGQVTIEINPEAMGEFATNEVQTEDENPISESRNRESPKHITLRIASKACPTYRTGLNRIARASSKLCSTWGNNCIFGWQKRFLGSQFRESLGEKKSLNPEVRETRESEILSPRVSFDCPWVMRKRLWTESSR